MTKSDFIKCLFDFCFKNGIVIASARPYEGDWNKYRDLDVVVHKQNIPLIENYIRQLALTVIDFYPHIDGYTVSLYGFTGEIKAFGIDFVTNLSFRGIDYLDVNSVLLRSESNRLHSIDQSLILLMTHGVRHKGNLKDSYKSYIAKTIERSQDSFSNALSSIFGLSNSLYFVEELKTKEFSKNMARKAITAFIAEHVKKDGLSSCVQVVIYYIKQVLYAFKTPRRSFAFYGVDGAGKTTLINAVSADMTQCFGSLRHFHFMPPWPGFADPDSNLVVSNPHALPNRGYSVSIIKALYYFLRCWLGYLQPLRTSTIFLYDRYLPDMLVDPRRLRYGGSSMLLRILCRLLPPINQSFWLKIDPTIAYQRKPEIPLFEVSRQSDVYKVLAHDFKMVILNGEAPLTANRALVRNSILSQSNKK